MVTSLRRFSHLPLIPWLMAFTIAHALDMLTTAIILAAGGYELNPEAVVFFEHFGVPLTFALQIPVIAFVWLDLFLVERYISRRGALATAIFLAVLAAAPVLWNLRNLAILAAG